MARQGTRLKKRLLWGVIIAVLTVIIAATIGATVSISGDEGMLREQVLELNNIHEELQNDSPEERDAALTETNQALEDAQDALRNAARTRDDASIVAIAFVALIAIAAIISTTLYLYRSVVRPFVKLEGFAEEVAAGNLDAPLQYDRSNPFGKFTWAFDHLRKELDRARKDEERTNEAHKTALAALSHDLRTPLASLRAYAEALEMGLFDSDSERTEYEHAIIRKCDDVSSLVEDLFQHALSDMDRIKVDCMPIHAAPIVEHCVRDLSGIVSISCTRLDDALIKADEVRLAQVIDNLIGNSLKYARGSAVEVEAIAQCGAYIISVRDFGPGMPAEDIPFATERFYRGSNATDQPGSGLGLFIAAYLMERMEGHLHLENAHPGLRVKAELPILA